jgi:hypothetical protein
MQDDIGESGNIDSYSRLQQSGQVIAKGRKRAVAWFIRKIYCEANCSKLHDFIIIQPFVKHFEADKRLFSTNR